MHDEVKCHRSSSSAAVLVGKGDRLRQFQGPTIVLDKICWRTIEINRFRLIINYNCYSKYESKQRRCLLFIIYYCSCYNCINCCCNCLYDIASVLENTIVQSSNFYSIFIAYLSCVGVRFAIVFVFGRMLLLC